MDTKRPSGCKEDSMAILGRRSFLAAAAVLPALAAGCDPDVEEESG